MRYGAGAVVADDLEFLATISLAPAVVIVLVHKDTRYSWAPVYSDHAFEVHRYLIAC